MNRSDKQTGIHIEPYSLLKDIVLNFWTVILAALIGLMAVSIWNGSVFTPVYTSSATLVINMGNSATYSYTALSSSTEMAKVFTEVFKQPTMKKYAASHLGMDDFSGSISAKVLEDTNIFTLSVTSNSPEMSYRELCAILEIYPEISDFVLGDTVVEVMRAPTLPLSPSNHISNTNRKLAVAGSGALVFLIIVLLSITRDTVKDERVFKEQIDARLFGIIGHEAPHMLLKERLKRRKTSLLITNAFASFRFTEHYHKLATKLEYLHRSKGVRIILLTSLAENEGKSTTSANIALALAKRKNKVVLLDMDFKKPALHKIFDMQNEDVQDLALLMSGQKPLASYRFNRYRDTNLDLALNKKSYNNYTDWLYSGKFKDIINDLRSLGQYDYIIIDTPPLSVAADVIQIAQLADLSLLVVRTDYVYSPAINDAVLSLKDNTKNFGGCILNDVHKEFTLLGQMGLDETGYTGNKKYSSYNSYRRYSDYQDTPPES